MDIKNQIAINNKFMETFKKTLIDNNINSLDLIKSFENYENTDLIDPISEKILKIMLNEPYFKDLKEANALVKFRFLQNKLKIIVSQINDINIVKRLSILRNT